MVDGWLHPGIMLILWGTWPAIVLSTAAACPSLSARSAPAMVRVCGLLAPFSQSQPATTIPGGNVPLLALFPATPSAGDPQANWLAACLLPV